MEKEIYIDFCFFTEKTIFTENEKKNILIIKKIFIKTSW